MTLEEVISKYKQEVDVMKSIVKNERLDLGTRYKYEHSVISTSRLIEDLEKIECKDFKGATRALLLSTL